jgi:hypothetical protein
MQPPLWALAVALIVMDLDFDGFDDSSSKRLLLTIVVDTSTNRGPTKNKK